jgi:hypothetical protein
MGMVGISTRGRLWRGGLVAFAEVEDLERGVRWSVGLVASVSASELSSVCEVAARTAARSCGGGRFVAAVGGVGGEADEWPEDGLVEGAPEGPSEADDEDPGDGDEAAEGDGARVGEELGGDLADEDDGDERADAEGCGGGGCAVALEADDEDG